MKYILILIIFFISSCVVEHTGVICPCQVTEIQISENRDRYKVTVKSIDRDPAATSSYFSFYTPNLYNIGDTIK